MATDTIREFLVLLGFKTDETALKNFEAGITKATKAVFGLAAAIETTAVAVSVGVARFASSLEALYFASIRTGSAATNLKAFDRAAQNFGTSAGEALSSVEGLARFLRTNPGGEGLLRSLGVQTRDANGNLRDTSEMLVDLGKQFAKMPTYLSSQYANIFGIDDKTMLALRNGDFGREFERMRKEMQNSGFEKATRDAHEFMMGLRDLQTFVEAFGVQVYDALVKKLGFSMKTLTEWLRVNGPMLAERVAAAIVKIISVAEWLGQKILWIVDKFIEWDSETGGLSTKLLGFVIALRLLGGAEIIGGVLSLAGAFIRLGAAITTASAATTTGAVAGAAGGGGWLMGLLGLGARATGAIGAGVGLGWLITKLFPNNPLAQFGEAIADKVYDFRHQKENAINALTNMGWSQAQAAGMVANFNAESALNPNAVNGSHRGIAQWDATRQANFARWAGFDLSDPRADTQKQLEFANYELRYGSERNAGQLMLASQNAARAGFVASHYYERPGSDAEDARRSAAAVNLSQSTVIHVNGSAEAAQTARIVADKQESVNAKLVRNIQTPVQ